MSSFSFRRRSPLYSGSIGVASESLGARMKRGKIFVRILQRRRNCYCSRGQLVSLHLSVWRRWTVCLFLSKHRLWFSCSPTRRETLKKEETVSSEQRHSWCTHTRSMPATPFRSFISSCLISCSRGFTNFPDAVSALAPRVRFLRSQQMYYH